MDDLIDFIITSCLNYNRLIRENNPSEAFRKLSYTRGLEDALFVAYKVRCEEEFFPIKEDPLESLENNVISKVTFSKDGEVIKFKEILFETIW